MANSDALPRIHQPPPEPRPAPKVPVPDMEVVTKGWWTMRVGRRSVDALEAENRTRRAKG